MPTEQSKIKTAVRAGFLDPVIFVCLCDCYSVGGGRVYTGDGFRIVSFGSASIKTARCSTLEKKREKKKEIAVVELCPFYFRDFK